MSETLLCLAAALLGWALTGLVLRVQDARHHARPNERSMHVRPTPVGGGLAIIAAAAILWPWFSAPLGERELLLLAGFLALAAMSWIDDLRPLWPVTRFAMQAVAVAICIIHMPVDQRVFPQVALPLERAALAIGWLWFINLYNFMDGIDGLAGTEAVAVTLGYVAVAAVASLKLNLAPLAIVIAGASVGYLMWNWHPARIFMGDVGSIPLGFVLGWLMIDLGTHGLLIAALALPLYFIADATITLARRLAAGARPWQAHRTHFYQRAVLGGITHADVVRRVIAADTVLLLAAVLSVARPWTALALAALAVATLLWSLERSSRASPSRPTSDSRAAA